MIEHIIEMNKGHEFDWFDIVSPTPEELEEIAESKGLHPTSVRACLDPEHLPKHEKIEDLVFLILRAYDEATSPYGRSIQELTRKIAVFYGPRFLITIHRQEQPFLVSLKAKWKNKASSKIIKNSSQLIEELLRAVISSYEVPYTSLEERLDLLESQTFSSDRSNFEAREAYQLIRTAAIIKRMLRSCIDVVDKIDGIIPKQSRPYFLNLKEDGERLYLKVGDLVENVNRILQLQISLASQRTNEVMRVLTIFSVFFMPLNLITGIYGMNFEHMPELRKVWAYPFVLFAMAIIALMIYFWFRWQGWLQIRKKN